MARLPLVSSLVCAIGTIACSGGSSPTAAPSPTSSPSASVPSTLQGTIQIGVFQLAVVNFTVDRAGMVSTRVDWGNVANDLDTALVRSRCTPAQVIAQSTGCNEAASLADDDSGNRPSMLSASAQPGEHTLAIFNWGPAPDTATYRVEGFVSGANAPAPASLRRTEAFPFTLTAGSRASIVVGTVQAGNGPLEVALDFSGAYTILACIGPSSACVPMGGRPTTRTFTVPSEFPAGPIQASVYFNPNSAQPPGNATGTLTMTYTVR